MTALCAQRSEVHRGRGAPCGAEAHVYPRHIKAVADRPACWCRWIRPTTRTRRQDSTGRPGLLGAITHLEAALEEWRYRFDSARFVFGHSLGDPTAGTILRAGLANAEGLTRSEISNLFGRNKNAVDIDRALALLVTYRWARRQSVDTDGRPAERWIFSPEAYERDEGRRRGKNISSFNSFPSCPPQPISDMSPDVEVGEL